MGNTGNQTQNGTQTGMQPFNSQPASGQMSAAGFTSGGVSLPGSGLTSGQMSATGFNSGQPMPGGSFAGSSMSGSGFNPTAGFSGSNFSPFQTGNSSSNSTGFTGSSQFNPTMFSGMFGSQNGQQSGTVDPSHLLGKSRYYIGVSIYCTCL